MRRWLPIALLAAVAVLGAWWWLRPASIGDGFASGNGRIEATEIDHLPKTNPLFSINTALQIQVMLHQ